MERFGAFLTEAAPQWQITLQHRPDVVKGDADWAVHEETFTRFHIAAYRGWVDLAARIGEVSAPSLVRAPSALARILVFIATVILPRERDGLLLHACGLAAPQAAYAFCGPSGAGKSTVTSLAPPIVQIMSDENVVVRLEENVPVLHSTPFWGQSTPEAHIQRMRMRRPLAALFILKQSPKWFLRPLRNSEAILALLATEKIAVERVESARVWLDVASRLIARTPIYELGFLPTSDLWPFLTSHGFLIF